jgi:hypothetical protein
MTEGFLLATPLWVILVVTVGAFLVAAELGYRIGRWRKAATSEATMTDMGITLGGLLGLLGLLLAFTFGMAGNRYEDRKSLVIEEANAIGTAWLRTDLIPMPQRAQARDVLREYTQARLDMTTTARRSEGIVRSEKLQGELWSITAAAAAASPTPTVALFVTAVNEVIDMHGRRVAAALRNPIPPTIFATLYAVAILVLGATGYAGGLSGDRSSMASLVLALVLAAVFALILDLDRPYEGLLTVSQQAIRDLLTMMQPVR